MKNATTTKKEYEYYRLAKEAIDRGEAENALFNIRKALERVVKILRLATPVVRTDEADNRLG